MTLLAAPLSKRLAALFLLAVGSVLVTVGAVLGRVAGPGPAAAYGVVVLTLVLLAARAAKRRVRAARLRAGRTCTCCTSSVHDPVQVI